jgi:Putative zinc-finger
MTHFSELTVDKYLAGELGREAVASLRAHAAECARCGDTLEDALAVKATFVHDRPAVPLWRRARVLYAAPVALAAALALVLAWPRPHAPQAEVTRAKGTAIVGCYVAHGDAIRRGALRETVMPGDRIELVTSTTEPVWFAAISDDAAGVRSVYAPATFVAPSRDQIAPAAIELDATLGREVVTGVFCELPFDAKTIDPAHPPAGCTTDHFELTKVAR